jgi:aspartate aminotransferase-like enzyme
MFRDWCTWDDDYNTIVEGIRRRLVRLGSDTDEYTTVLMQGSGTFCVEATVITAVPRNGKLLVLANGAYGRRIAGIARRCGIAHEIQDSGELAPPDPERLEAALKADGAITHVAVVHCETTTGMLNSGDGHRQHRQGPRAAFHRGCHEQLRWHPDGLKDYGCGLPCQQRQQVHPGRPGFWICHR